MHNLDHEQEEHTLDLERQWRSNSWKEAKDPRDPDISSGEDSLGPLQRSNFRNPSILSDGSQRIESEEDPCTELWVSSERSLRSN